MSCPKILIGSRCRLPLKWLVKFSSRFRLRVIWNTPKRYDFISRANDFSICHKAFHKSWRYLLFSSASLALASWSKRLFWLSRSFTCSCSISVEIKASFRFSLSNIFYNFPSEELVLKIGKMVCLDLPTFYLFFLQNGLENLGITCWDVRREHHHGFPVILLIHSVAF